MVFKTLFLLLITIVALIILAYGTYLGCRWIYERFLSDVAQAREDKLELKEYIETLTKLKEEFDAR